ncbi:MAG: cytochrome c family protein [Rhodospirillaceae bacterium]
MRKFSKFGLGLAAALALLAVGGKAFADDAVEAGEKAYKKYCGACHTVEEGKNRVGPSLHSVVGRHSGAVAGYAYSAANTASGIVWTEDKLDAYLADPKAVVPGTKMTFSGVKDAEQRTAIIAYLKTK